MFILRRENCVAGPGRAWDSTTDAAVPTSPQREVGGHPVGGKDVGGERPGLDDVGGLGGPRRLQRVLRAMDREQIAHPGQEDERPDHVVDVHLVQFRHPLRRLGVHPVHGDQRCSGAFGAQRVAMEGVRQWRVTDRRAKRPFGVLDRSSDGERDGGATLCRPPSVDTVQGLAVLACGGELAQG